MEFIDLRRTSYSAVENEDEARTSALGQSPKYNGLRVIGELPHGYEFEPASVADAESLITWLRHWVDEQS